jgi:hypothetical protein
MTDATPLRVARFERADDLEVMRGAADQVLRLIFRERLEHHRRFEQCGETRVWRK